MKTNGFGDFACTSANDYIVQYVLTYQRGVCRQPPAPAAEATEETGHEPEAPARGAF
jgi:hypothetical protein